MPDDAPNWTEVPEVILSVARHQNDKQDARLESHKRQAIIVAGGYLTTGTITVAAITPELSAAAATVVLIWSLTTSLMAGYVQWLADWDEDPDVEHLIDDYYDRGYGRHVIELDLAATLDAQYHRNEETLQQIKKWLVAQAVVAFAGVCVLIAVLLAVT